MTTGQKVTIRPEYLDPGADPSRQFDIVEDFGEGRVAIAPTVWAWRIRPHEVVRVSMIQIVGEE